MPSTLERKRRLLVGWLVLVALVLLGVSLAWLRSIAILPRENSIYYVLFDRVNGLRIGDPVEIKGWPVGRVAKIAPVGELIQVQVELTENIQLTEGSRARLVQAELFGAKRIELTLAPRQKPLKPGSSLMGIAEPDLTEAITRVGELLKSVPSDKLESLINNLTQASCGASQLLKRENIQQIEEILIQTQLLLKDLQNLIRSIESQQIAKRLSNVLESAQHRLDQAEKLVDSLTTTTSRFNRLIPYAEQSLQKADTALTKINALLNRIDQEGTLAYRLLNDSTLSNRLDTTLVNLNQTLDFIRRRAIQVRVRFFNSRRDAGHEHQLK